MRIQNLHWQAILAGFFFLFAWSNAKASSRTVEGSLQAPQREISKAWQTRRDVMTLGQDPFGEKELLRIEALKNQYGLRSLPEVSIALLRETKSLTGSARSTADDRARLAKTLSPSLPAVFFYDCPPYSPSKIGIMEKVENCFRGLALQFESPFEGIRLITNAFLVGMYVLLFLTILFFLVLFLKYFVPTAHLWQHRIRGLPPSGAMALILAILVLGWIVGGWLAVILAQTLVFWRYWNRSERIFVTVFFLFLGALPFGFFAPAYFQRVETGIEKVILTNLDTVNLNLKAKELETWLSTQAHDAQALFALAQIYRHTGQNEIARQTYEKALEKRPNWGKALINLANLDYLDQNFEGAIHKLEKATSAGPESVIGNFNLGKIFYRLTRLEDGLNKLNKAKEIDAKEFFLLDAKSKDYPEGIYLPDEMITVADLKDRIWQMRPEIQKAQENFHHSLFPQLPMPLYWITIFGTLIFSLIADLLWRVPRKPRKCEKCGVPSDALKDPSIERENLCSQCFHVFVRLEPVDAENRNKLEKRISRFRSYRELRERWSALLLPGLHLMFQERFFAGLFLTLISSTLLILLFCKSLLIPSSFEQLRIYEFPFSLFLIVGFLCIYVFSALGALKR